jgi:hypothetical protein
MTLVFSQEFCDQFRADIYQACDHVEEIIDRLLFHNRIPAISTIPPEYIIAINGQLEKQAEGLKGIFNDKLESLCRDYDGFENELIDIFVRDFGFTHGGQMACSAFLFEPYPVKLSENEKNLSTHFTDIANDDIKALLRLAMSKTISLDYQVECAIRQLARGYTTEQAVVFAMEQDWRVGARQETKAPLPRAASTGCYRIDFCNGFMDAQTHTAQHRLVG